MLAGLVKKFDIFIEFTKTVGLHFVTRFHLGYVCRCNFCWGAWVGAGRGRPLPQWGSGDITPENFGNFICQTVHFLEYLCDNWSTKWANFVVFNTDVEA